MSVAEGQKRLRRIAQTIESEETLDETDRRFLIVALTDIADGKDAASALDVKAKRGERKSKQSSQRRLDRKLALAWIAAARLPENEGGLGLTLDDACAKLSALDPNLFNFTEETLRSYWSKNPVKQKAVFDLED